MESVLFLAFGKHWAGEFACPIDIVRLDPQPVFHSGAHTFGPGFCSENSGFELGIFFDVYTHLFCNFPDMEQVRWGAGDGCYLEILHQFNLAFGISDTCREYGCTDALCTIMHAKATGK